MSNALKCDKCKKPFDPTMIGEDLIARFGNPSLRNANDIKNDTVSGWLFDGRFPADAKADLCPDCTNKFIAFMMGKDTDSEEMDYLYERNAELEEKLAKLRKDYTTLLKTLAEKE